MEVRSLFLILLSNFSNREISLKEILFPSNVIFSSARVSVIGNRYISIGSLRRWIIFPLENISPLKNPFYPRYALINNIKITRIHSMRSTKSIDAMLALLAQLPWKIIEILEHYFSERKRTIVEAISPFPDESLLYSSSFSPREIFPPPTKEGKQPLLSQVKNSYKNSVAILPLSNSCNINLRAGKTAG